MEELPPVAAPARRPETTVRKRAETSRLVNIMCPQKRQGDAPAAKTHMANPVLNRGGVKAHLTPNVHDHLSCEPNTFLAISGSPGYGFQPRIVSSERG